MKILKAIPLAFVLFLFSSLSLAEPGRIVVRDDAHLITPVDFSTLKNDAAKWPFETHVLTRVTSTKLDLENTAKAWVDGPNVIVIAVDPAHKVVLFRFGTGTGVRDDGIASAGNAFFKDQKWVSGIDAIGMRAASTVRATPIIVTPAPSPVIVQTVPGSSPVVVHQVHQGLGFWGWTLIILGIAAVVWFIVYLFRKSQRDSARFQAALDDNRVETASLAGRNLEADRWDASLRASTARSSASSGGSVRSTVAPTMYRRASSVPAYVPAAPAAASASSTVVVNNHGGGGSDLVTGMVLGSMMSDHHHHDRVIERDVIVERVAPTYGTPSYDSGGSSSSFGGSSYDSGGSSSSFDSSSGSSYDSGSSGSSSSFDSGGSSSYDSGSSGSSSSWDSSSSSDSGSSSYDSGGSSSFDSGSSDSGSSDSSF